MKDLQTIQYEQAEWSRRNFGLHPATDPLLGVVEEVGELAHAILKLRQGIRGTFEEHQAAAKDAVGDILIYLCDGATCAGVELAWPNRHLIAEPPPGTTHQGDAVIGELAKAAGELLANAARRPSFNGQPNPNGDCRRAFFDAVLCRIEEVCFWNGLGHPPHILAETWEVVSKRDWTKNKLTGENA